MKLVSYRAPDGEPSSGEVRDGHVVAFGDGSTVLSRLADGDRSPATGDAHALDDVRLLAPHRPPRAILGDRAQLRRPLAGDGQRAAAEPIVFMKLPTSSTAPNDAGAPAGAVRRLDYEGELAIVMGAGRRGRRLRGGRRPQRARPAGRASRSGRAPRASTTPARGARGSRPPTRCPTPRRCRCARGSTASCARTPRRAT